MYFFAFSQPAGECPIPHNIFKHLDELKIIKLVELFVKTYKECLIN